MDSNAVRGCTYRCLVSSCAFCILEASYSFLNAFEMLKEQPKFSEQRQGVADVFEKIRIIFTIPELRQRSYLLSACLRSIVLGGKSLANCRSSRDAHFAEESGGISDLLKTVAVFSASQLSQATIFGLGIMPYISASIIFQLLGTVWPPLERLQKEGESGRKKINEYTRMRLLAFVCCRVGHMLHFSQILVSVSVYPVKFSRGWKFAIFVAVGCSSDNDGRHRVPYVAW